MRRLAVKPQRKTGRFEHLSPTAVIAIVSSENARALRSDLGADGGSKGPTAGFGSYPVTIWDLRTRRAQRQPSGRRKGSPCNQLRGGVPLCSERHFGEPAHVGRVESFDPVPVNFVFGKPLDELFQRDSRLEPSEWCTQAEMNAVAEG